MPNIVHSDTLEAIAKANETILRLRNALEYVVAARDKVSCRCGSLDFHHDDCPIGYAINALAER